VARRTLLLAQAAGEPEKSVNNGVYASRTPGAQVVVIGIVAATTVRGMRANVNQARRQDRGAWQAGGGESVVGGAVNVGSVGGELVAKGRRYTGRADTVVLVNERRAGRDGAVAGIYAAVNAGDNCGRAVLCLQPVGKPRSTR